MDAEEFKGRTKAYAIAVIHLVERLPRTVAGNVIARQLIKSGTSVGANYRAACRARSRAEMIAKLQIVHEESDESIYWLEIAIGASMLSASDVAVLMDEGNQITAMIVSSLKTLKDGHNSGSAG